uniref:Keratin n=1 Tax=Chelydra serpentina TaxID=8475 RepID=A0A8C3T903_CHESE
MSCSSLCYPECGVARPSPVSGSCNEPCVRQCPDSEVVIRPSPVVITLPGPILSNFPQHSGVGAVGAPVVGPGNGGSFGLGGLSSYGGRYGGLYGYGGLGGYGGHYANGSCPCSTFLDNRSQALMCCVTKLKVSKTEGHFWPSNVEAFRDMKS